MWVLNDNDFDSNFNLVKRPELIILYLYVSDSRFFDSLENYKSFRKYTTMYTFCKVDVNINKSVFEKASSRKIQIRSLPALIVFYEGQPKVLYTNQMDISLVLEFMETIFQTQIQSLQQTKNTPYYPLQTSQVQGNTFPMPGQATPMMPPNGPLVIPAQVPTASPYGIRDVDFASRYGFRNKRSDMNNTNVYSTDPEFTKECIQPPGLPSYESPWQVDLKGKLF